MSSNRGFITGWSVIMRCNYRSRVYAGMTPLPDQVLFIARQASAGDKLKSLGGGHLAAVVEAPSFMVFNGCQRQGDLLRR